jgi:hypothetical protein
VQRVSPGLVWSRPRGPMVRGYGSWRLKSGGWRNPDGAGRRLSHRVLGCRAPEVDWSAGQPCWGFRSASTGVSCCPRVRPRWIVFPVETLSRTDTRSGLSDGDGAWDRV